MTSVAVDFDAVRRKVGWRVLPLVILLYIVAYLKQFGANTDHFARCGSRLGAFKTSVELIVEQYWRHFRNASVGIRPQVASGPEREVGLTAGPPLAARAAARGERFCIGYDYVENVARAFVRAALETTPGAHVLDLPGEIADTTEVVDAILNAVSEAKKFISINGPSIPTHAPPRRKFISSLYQDWKTTPLTEGIRRTVDFYRQQQTTH